MRGYFDALLRSTGVAADGLAQSVAQTAPGVVELDTDTRAETIVPRDTRAADRVEPLATGELARESDPRPVAPVAPVSPVAAVGAVAVVAPDAPVARQSPAEPAVTRAATMTSDQEPIDLGKAMVRAAMRWVAADAVAQQVGAPEAEAQAHRHEVTPHREAASVELPAQRVGHTETAARPAFSDPMPRQPVTTTPAMIPAAPSSPAPPARDGVFEVSIGAIHVRVDAPAVQTVPAPQAPPAAPSRASAARPQRSTLSRRALRRI
jgi:hypothetical protein